MYAGFGHTSCVFEIPMYAVGKPVYDPWWIKEELIKMLDRDGFNVAVVDGLHLYINWSIDDLGPPKIPEDVLIDRENRKKKKDDRRRKRKEKRLLKGL